MFEHNCLCFACILAKFSNSQCFSVSKTGSKCKIGQRLIHVWDSKVTILLDRWPLGSAKDQAQPIFLFFSLV